MGQAVQAYRGIHMHAMPSVFLFSTRNC